MITFSKPCPSSAHAAYSPQEAKFRLLILPDWQGGQTSYLQRMGNLFGEALTAETWLFHPYAQQINPKTYEPVGRRLVADALSDRALCRQWMATILQDMEPHWRNSNVPLIVLGFCFGGTLAFEAARQSRLISAAVSIHGNPATTSNLPIANEQTAMVLVQGGSDPLIPQQHLDRFADEMKHSTRTWFQHTIGQARHSFTKHEVGKIGPGSVYDAHALTTSVKVLSALLPNVTAAS